MSRASLQRIPEFSQFGRFVADVERAASKRLVEAVEVDRSSKSALDYQFQRLNGEGSVDYQRPPVPDHDLRQFDRRRIIEDTVKFMNKLIEKSKMRAGACANNCDYKRPDNDDVDDFSWPGIRDFKGEETAGSTPKLGQTAIDFAQQVLWSLSVTSGTSANEVEKYILHCAKVFPGISLVAMALAATYIERFCDASADWEVTPHNFKGLFLAALTLAHKFLDDYNHSNRKIAKLGEVSLEELNSLERQMWTTLDCRMSATAAPHYELGKLRHLGEKDRPRSKVLSDIPRRMKFDSFPHSRL